jgi:hypothetical protein
MKPMEAMDRIVDKILAYKPKRKKKLKQRRKKTKESKKRKARILATIMLMWFLASLFNVSMSAPRGSQNKGPENIEGSADQNKKPAANISTIKKPATTENSENEGKTVTPKNNEQTVTVTKMPEVAVQTMKDKWDKALVCLTGALVFVAGIQIIF